MMQKTMNMLKCLWNWLKSLYTFFCDNTPRDMEKITKEDYYKLFVQNRTKEEIEKAYQKAWESKNFEIENYWKRANYFWAFQVVSFGGYFSILNSEIYNKYPQVLYCVITIGIITSFAWAFINNGSKAWQRNWENQVEMLEDEITGPLYKVVTVDKTFSVSKINEIVSRYFVVVWVVLAINYFVEKITFCSENSNGFDYVVFLSTASLIYFVGAMFFGYGRGRFGRRKVIYYKKNIHFME